MELARLRADGIRAPEGKECAEARSMTRPVLNFRIRGGIFLGDPPKNTYLYRWSSHFFFHPEN